MSPGRGPAVGRRALVGVAAVALLLAGFATPVGSAADPAAGAVAAHQSQTNATLAVHVEREGSTMRYTATVTAPADADRTRIDGAFGMLNVTGTDGFVAAGAGYRLRDGREQGTLTASIDLAEPRATPLGRVGPDGPFQAGDGWAFAPSPRYHVRWWSDGKQHSTDLRKAQNSGNPTESVVSADESVAVGERFVFLGPHSVRTEQVGGQTVRVVVPEAASFAVGAERAVAVARTVTREAGTTPDRPVTAFVLPRAVRAGGSASGTDLWMRADAGERTVAHEFAHTALDVPTTAETRWLSEAAAEYLAHRATTEAGVTETLRGRVTDGDAVLADRTTWDGEHVAYRKGAAVLALLDDRIRTATDGEQSVAAVLVRLSAVEGTIDATTLRETVAAVADDETAAWLEEQTTSTAPAALPEKQAAGLGVTDALSERLPGERLSLANATALLAVFGALSVLVWVPLQVGYLLCRRLSRVVAT